MPVKNGDPAAGAFAEPFAVCLHAVHEAPVYGARVLVMGAGPIGSLLVLAARFAGAREIVTVDVKDAPLAYARKVGADHTINLAEHGDQMAAFTANKGYFDVVFEAAGQGSTVASALQYTKPRGTIMLVGQGATATGNVCFELPAEAAGAAVMYASAGFTNDDIYFQLV